MALTTTSLAVTTNPVNAVFQQEFLRRAQQVCPYFMGTKAGSMVQNGGSTTIKWRRLEQATPTTSALSEITTAAYMQSRTPEAVSLTDVVAVVAKYGQFYIVTEEVDLSL